MNNEMLISDVKTFFLAGIQAVHPHKLIDKKLSFENNSLIISDISGTTEEIDLSDYEKIIIIGAGKASAVMAEKLEELFITANIKISGLIVTKYGFGENLKRIKVFEAGHPLPDDNGIKAAENIVKLCSSASEKDLIINLLSGGASSLLPAPVEGISLKEKIKVTNLLLKSGATIDEVNTIRKHLSKIKGGKLLLYAHPAKVVSLIISDVIGDRLDIIGSGLTYPDVSTFNDSLEIIKKYRLEKSFPNSVISYLTKKADAEKGTGITDINFSSFNFSNYIIANNYAALRGIKKMAEAAGYIPKIMKKNLSGEAREVGAKIVKDVVNFKRKEAGKNKKFCLLYGGETTVTIQGNGKGGRNQELVLSAADALQGVESVVLLSGGTDGNDGPTDAAGAYCNGKTIQLGNELGLNSTEYLNNNDSYNYFKKINNLLFTGPTGTNVADVVIVLIQV